MEWIRTRDKLPLVGQKIEMTCKHWEKNWKNNFSDKYIEKGSYDEFGNFWDCEGCRLHNPSYWRPYQPERSKREDSCEHAWFKTTSSPMQCMRCGALNSMET